MGINSGFTGINDLWWWCEDHEAAELNPPGLHGGLASEGHRWLGPYTTEAACTSFNTGERHSATRLDTLEELLAKVFAAETWDEIRALEVRYREMRP